jgi:hypothetical protein
VPALQAVQSEDAAPPVLMRYRPRAQAPPQLVAVPVALVK